jgi:hypothetical protein
MADLEDRQEEPATAAAIHNRRRPGRVEYGNWTLIRMLRRPSSGPIEDKALDNINDDSAPFPGIVIGLLISVPIWGLIGLVVWLLLS